MVFQSIQHYCEFLIGELVDRRLYVRTRLYACRSHAGKCISHRNRAGEHTILSGERSGKWLSRDWINTAGVPVATICTDLRSGDAWNPCHTIDAWQPTRYCRSDTKSGNADGSGQFLDALAITAVKPNNSDDQ